MREGARALFIAGSLPFVLLGFGHASLAFLDVWRPRTFTPADDLVRRSMKKTGVAGYPRVNLWRAWLGFNISHGMGVLVFGLVFFLIALYDFDLISSVPGLGAIAVGVPAAYFVLSLRFWFWGPALGSGIGLVLLSLGVAL
ncbi:MAG: LIC_13387 family protein [Actinomycetota bacterium]